MCPPPAIYNWDLPRLDHLHAAHDPVQELDLKTTAYNQQWRELRERRDRPPATNPRARWAPPPQNRPKRRKRNK